MIFAGHLKPLHLGTFLKLARFNYQPEYIHTASIAALALRVWFVEGSFCTEQVCIDWQLCRAAVYSSCTLWISASDC